MLEQTISIGEASFQFLPLPGGEVHLNDDRIQQRWRTQLKPFRMGKFPVTQSQFSQLTGRSPSAFVGANLPVESVSWREAVEFCNLMSQQLGLELCYQIEEEMVSFDPAKAGVRLPTEAEWQFACQAGSTGIRYGELDEIAWYKGNSQQTIHAVGLKLPNAWGLHDMLGNVWEWCSDIYDQDVYGTYRIFRGGGWSDEARSVMATTRRRSHPIKFRIDDLGFRLAINGV